MAFKDKYWKTGVEDILAYKGKKYNGEYPTFREMLEITEERFPNNEAFKAIVPEKITFTYKEALKIASELDITLVPYENERGMDATREIMGQLKAGQTIGVVVGPEGGFAPEEIALVDEHATMHRISLGRRILRTETAGLAVLAMLVYNLDV